MWHMDKQRHVRARRTVVVVVSSGAIALGLLLLYPALAGAVHNGSGSQALAAPAFHQGGPDEFGYTFKDSNEPGGPAYAWEDIASSGTMLYGWTGYDDGYAGPIPIGFTFNYYGQDYSQLYVGTNGYLSFGRGFWSGAGGTPPQTYEPNNDIALFGGDMYLNNYGADTAVYYQTLSNPTRFVVEYVRLYYCCGQNTPHTLEAILYPNGDIQAQYKTLNGTSSEYVGIENADGTDGLAYGISLGDSLAIRYYYPRGVLLAPPTQSGYGEPGTVVTYTMQVTNRTGNADSFDLAVQPGNLWDTELSIAQTGVLPDGDSMSFEAYVSIPAGAAGGDADQATVQATSVTSPTITSTAQINTSATSGEIAYVTLSQSNLVALVDVALHTVIDTVNVGAAGCAFPWRAAITPAGDQVFVSCYNSGSVVIIDTTDNTITTTIGGIQQADGVAFTRDGRFALVGSRWTHQIVVVDTQTYALGYIPTNGSTRSIAVHPYLSRAYVTSSDDTLLVIDTTNFSIVASIPVFGNPWDVATSTDGRWVFTGDRYGAGLAVIDASDNTLETRVTNVGSLTGLEVAPDGSAIYGAGLGNGVQVFDGTTFQLMTTIYNTGSAWELAATCDGGEIWVGNSSNAVPVIDSSINQVTQVLAMPGVYTKGIAICPQYAANALLLLPPAQSHSGALDQVVIHTITLANATGSTDSFNLSLGPHTWPARLLTTTIGPLADGQVATFDVAVTVPSGAAWYDSETMEVMAVGVAHPSFADTANVTTVAYGPPAIGVSPNALRSVQYVNQTVDQLLTISNGNGVTLTVEISDIDVTSDTVTAAPLDLPLPRDVFAGGSTAGGDSRPPLPPPPAQGVVPRVIADGQQPSPQIQSGSYYTTTVDNEDNAHTGNPDYDMDTDVCGGYSVEPIEFNIFVDRVPGPTGNVLTVRAYDVDWPSEEDEVRLNGTYLGNLVGGGDTWSETSFDVPPGVVVMGANLVEIDLTGNGWCTTVDWGELFVSSRPANWLSENPQSATLLANHSQDVTVTFDSTGLQPKQYLGAVILANNDPTQPHLQVPASLNVLPTPDMGRVVGAISDLWTGLPLQATVDLAGVYTMTADPDYEIWATAGAYTLNVSAAGYHPATFQVTITAGGTTVQDVALEPELARMEWSPAAIEANVSPGGATSRILTIANTGPAPLDVALFEINIDVAQRPPTPGDLTGKRILYDRSHGQPPASDYDILVQDAIAAGATVDENWYFPVDDLVLDGYDILWTNCCGGITWGLSELLAIQNWLQDGGAVFVQGENSAATAGPASVFDIYYFSGNCNSGWTNNILPHPITAGVSTVDVEYTCWRLSPSAGSDVVVYDPAGQPHVITKEYNGGKMVAVASEDFISWIINSVDNRLLANNILGWLARPTYSDVTWLAVSPISGTVPGHSSLPVTVSFDAGALNSGVYEARLAVEHNDPNQPFPVEIPVTLTVHPPTAVVLGEMTTDQAAFPAAAPPLPVAGIPAVAALALSLAAWRSRR